MKNRQVVGGMETPQRSEVMKRCTAVGRGVEESVVNNRCVETVQL